MAFQRAGQFGRAMKGNIDRLDAELVACLLGGAPFRLLARMVRVRQHRELAKLRMNVLEQFDRLPASSSERNVRAGEIAAGLRRGS